MALFVYDETKRNLTLICFVRLFRSLGLASATRMVSRPSQDVVFAGPNGSCWSKVYKNMFEIFEKTCFCIQKHVFDSIFEIPQVRRSSPGEGAGSILIG